MFDKSLDELNEEINIWEEEESHSLLCKMVKSQWCLAATNVLLMTVFHQNHIDLVMGSDFNCGCGQCEDCYLQIHLANHNMSVAQARVTGFLKVVS